MFKIVIAFVGCFVFGVFAGAPSLKPVPIRPCGDYVAPGTQIQTNFNHDSDRILNALDTELSSLNATHWSDPRAIYDPALNDAYKAQVEEVRVAYWQRVIDFANVFKADPYDMYYVMENLPKAPRPYNCILGILTSVYNLRQTTLLQASITLDLYISFRDDYDNLPGASSDE